MIFAEMVYQGHYSEFHEELVEFINSKYSKVESGLQGDSWIWIFNDNCKVAIDTFSSMKHQIKCDTFDCPLVNSLINTLSDRYNLNIYTSPEPEPHEDLHSI